MASKPDGAAAEPTWPAVTGQGGVLECGPRGAARRVQNRLS
jgi:hypothetical protein